MNKFFIPDCGYYGPENNFTQIPNELIRSNELSAKAKMVLFIMLSNNNWKNWKSQLLKCMKEGETSLRAALQELENQKYLVRLQYFYKKPKKGVAGNFWIYTNKAGVFDVDKIINVYKLLKNQNMELKIRKLKDIINKPIYDKIYKILELQNTENEIHADNDIIENNNVDCQHVEKQHVDSIPHKNTNNKNINKVRIKNNGGAPPEGRLITIEDFNKFMGMYPNTKFKYAKKGEAYNEWVNLCSSNNTPKWGDIVTALKKHIKSAQWKIENGKFIPMPVNWLKNKKWLDDISGVADSVDFNKKEKTEFIFDIDRIDGE